MEATVNENGEVVLTMSADDAQKIADSWGRSGEPRRGDGPAVRIAHAINDSIEFIPIPRVEAKVKANPKDTGQGEKSTVRIRGF